MEDIRTIHDLRKRLKDIDGHTEIYFSLNTKGFDSSIALKFENIYIHGTNENFVEIYLRDPNDHIYYGKKDREKVREIEKIIKKEGS